MAVFDAETIDQYTEAGHWTDESLAELVRQHAEQAPEGAAYVAPDHTLTWREYEDLSNRIAAGLAAAGFGPGAFLGVMMPDGALVHAVFLAAEKAGIVFVGLGPRTGDREAAHLLGLSGAEGLVTLPTHRGRETDDLFEALRKELPELQHHVVVDLEGGEPTMRLDGDQLPLADAATARSAIDGRALGPNDLFCLNSTSGTTGQPKLVMQTMNIWKYFGPLASEAGVLGDDEVFLSLLPAPFGFGLWTAHIVPTMYAYPTVVLEEFDVEEAFRAIEKERATVLAAVSTQFIMMLNSPAMEEHDLSSLRVLFTGGERVPFERAAEFEERTGCHVLQFYGSNEAGPISVTRVSDTTEQRLATSGRIVEAMQPRLFDSDGNDVTATGGPAQCGCKGPGLTPGYYNDPTATAELFRDDGWLLTGDIVEIDDDDYLTVVGRASDFIIRGGHNISAVAVEDALVAHPRLARVAAVGMPDEVLGERVCVYVVTTDGKPVELDELTAYLEAEGVSKTEWPERVIVTDSLPVAPGGKTRKSELREDIRSRIEAGRADK